MVSCPQIVVKSKFLILAMEGPSIPLAGIALTTTIWFPVLFDETLGTNNGFGAILLLCIMGPDKSLFATVLALSNGVPFTLFLALKVGHA